VFVGGGSRKMMACRLLLLCLAALVVPQAGNPDPAEREGSGACVPAKGEPGAERGCPATRAGRHARCLSLAGGALTGPGRAALVVVIAQRTPTHLRLCLRSLREALDAVRGFAWEVSIVEGDGEGAGSLSRQAFLASAALFPGAQVLFNDSGEQLTLAAATRRATVGAQAEHIFFLHDTVEVSGAALERMVAILDQDCRVALVASASLRPDGGLFHRGVSFDLGPRHKRCLSSNTYDDDFSYGKYGSRRQGEENYDGPLAWTSQAIWAFHEGQGLRPAMPAPPSAGPGHAGLTAVPETMDRTNLTLVSAVSEGCWVIRRSVWRQLAGLDPHVPDALAVIDLSLRVRRHSYRIALQNEWWVTHHADAPASGGGGGNCNTETKNIGEYIGGVQLRGTMEERWGKALYGTFQRRKIQSAVAWNMECGDDAVRGLTTEAVNLLVALNPLVNVVPQVSDRRDCEAMLLRTFPACISGQVMRMLHKQLPPGNVIQVMHRDPGRYRSFKKQAFGKEEEDSILYVGRSMYETDRIPSDWLVPATCAVDELWVPSDFNRRTFAAAGVPEGKLRVLHEAVDTRDLFTPENRGGEQGGNSHADAATAGRHILPPCGGDDLHARGGAGGPQSRFRILSVFKWEHRKGWDVLLRAYWRAFSARDHVCLYVRSKMDASNMRDFEQLQKEMLAERCGTSAGGGDGGNAQGDDSPDAGDGVGRSGSGGCGLAPVAIIKKALPYSLLPALYRSVHAVVLPSRGEGWGLPLLEAMAAGLPTVGTNWSGNTQFMSDSTSILLDYSLSEVRPPPHEGRTREPDEWGGVKVGHMWADASCQHLVKSLTLLFRNETFRAELGARARTHVAREFSHEALARQAVALLMQLERSWQDVLSRRQDLPPLCSPVSLPFAPRPIYTSIW